VNISPIHLDSPEIGPYASLEEVSGLSAVAEVDRHPPGAFLVWRIDKSGPIIGTRRPLPFGSYVLELFVSNQAAANFMQQHRLGPEKVTYARKASELNGRHAITFRGDLDYDAPAGELELSWSFPEMVIAEDWDRFVAMGRNRDWR
jgi:hypothetical protein